MEMRNNFEKIEEGEWETIWAVWENKRREMRIILSCLRKYLALARALAGHFWSRSLWIKVFHENAVFCDDDDENNIHYDDWNDNNDDGDEKNHDDDAEWML